VAGAALSPSRSSRARTAAVACAPRYAVQSLAQSTLWRAGHAVSCRYAAADDSNTGLIGKRCLVRSCQRGPKGFAARESKWMGSDFNGAFAQFVKVHSV
jgi:hypothetical protein